MISYSLEQGLAYGILTLLVLCIAFCMLNVIYTLLVHLLRSNSEEDELNDRFTNSFV